MAVINLIIQSALLLCSALHIQGKETVYFCQSKTVIITCNIDLSETHVLYWYYNYSTQAVASYTFTSNSSWPDDEGSPYFPKTDKLYVTAAIDREIWICLDPDGNHKEFILHQYRIPTFSREIINCPKDSVDNGTMVKLTCIADGFYPEGSVEMSWLTSGDRSMLMPMVPNVTVSNDNNGRFNLRSDLSLNILNSRNVTCLLNGSAMCTGNLTKTCSVVIKDPSGEKSSSNGQLVGIAVVVVSIFIIAL